MKKNQKLTKKILTLCLSVCLVLLAMLSGCAAKTETPETTAAQGLGSYTMTLHTEGGMAFSGIEVFAYGDEALTDLVAVGSTNAEGSVTFTAPTRYTKLYAVPKSIPKGYAQLPSYLLEAATTPIVLKSQLAAAPETVGKGDIMFDFSVTATDGTTYKLSELLAQKKAVVLNFWFEQCNPCREEFPYLQEAWEQYSDEIAVLALSPVDDAETVKQYQQDMGLTFPMASVDASWQNYFGLQYFPTTVIIDRYGMISLRQTGTVPDTATFADAFAFYTADDYQQQLVSDISDLQVEAEPDGTKENPFTFGGVKEFEVQVESGATVYCHVYKVSGMQLSIAGESLCVKYNEQNYRPENGGITFGVSSPDPYTPVELAITNNGSAAKTVKVEFAFLPGTMDNPYTLELGEFTADIAAGNSQGVYYTYTAQKYGVLSLNCLSATSGVEYSYSLYNLNTYAYRALESDGENGKLTIQVNAGDVLQIVASTLPNGTNEYPAAQLKLVAAFEEQVPPATVPTTQPTTVPPTQPVTVPPVQPTTPAATVPQATTPVTTVPPATVPPTTSGSTEREFTSLYGGEIKAYHLTEGTNQLSLTAGKLNYFLFTPTQSGMYKFTGSHDLRYFGTNLSFISDQTSTVNRVNNSFDVNIKESNIGASYLLGIQAPSGVTSGSVTIQRTGEAQLEWDDLPYDVYNGVYTPQSWTFGGGTLTYVDVTKNASNYNLVLGSDGFYHMNSADGPVVYLNLGSDSTNEAQETDITLYSMLNSNRPIIQGTVKDANGNNLYKRQYNDLVQRYIDCASSGLYGLTPDLMEILKTQNDSWYIWLASSNSRVKQDAAWMANLCYVQ